MDGSIEATTHCVAPRRASILPLRVQREISALSSIAAWCLAMHAAASSRPFSLLLCRCRPRAAVFTAELYGAPTGKKVPTRVHF
jgi:hypothetical protein